MDSSQQKTERDFWQHQKFGKLRMQVLERHVDYLSRMFNPGSQYSTLSTVADMLCSAVCICTSNIYEVKSISVVSRTSPSEEQDLRSLLSDIKSQISQAHPPMTSDYLPAMSLPAGYPPGWKAGLPAISSSEAYGMGDPSKTMQGNFMPLPGVEEVFLNNSAAGQLSSVAPPTIPHRTVTESGPHMDHPSVSRAHSVPPTDMMPARTASVPPNLDIPHTSQRTESVSSVENTTPPPKQNESLQVEDISPPPSAPKTETTSDPDTQPAPQAVSTRPSEDHLPVKPKVENDKSSPKRTRGARKRKSTITKKMVHKSLWKREKVTVSEEEEEVNDFDTWNDDEDLYNSLEEDARLLSEHEGTQGKRSSPLRKLFHKKPEMYNKLVFTEFRCPLCCKSNDKMEYYPNESELLEHWATEHMEVVDSTDHFSCVQCKYELSFRNTRSTFGPMAHMFTYIHHYVNEHDLPAPDFIQQFPCHVRGCTHRAFSKEGFRSHIKTHDPEFGECPKCHKTVQNKYLQGHIRGCGKKGPEEGIRSTFLNFMEHGCFICEEQPMFESVQDLVAHVEELHTGRNDVDRKIFSCPICTQSFVIGQSRCYKAAFQVTLCFLLHHMVKKHNFPVPPFIKSFPCTKAGCSYFTVSYEALKTHLKTHGEKITCQRCGAKCSQTSIYFHNKVCLVSEDQRQTYECNICKMAFKCKMTMIDHKVRKHTDQSDVRSYKCMCCTYICARELDLLRHLYGRHKINMKDLPVYSCKLCDYTHIHHLAVKKHKAKVHSTKDCLCPHCGKVFRHATYLRKHMESHGNHVYRCDKCTFSTNRQLFLQRHVQAQHDHVMLRCDKCGYSTGYSANMAKHRKNCRGEKKTLENSVSLPSDMLLPPPPPPPPGPVALPAPPTEHPSNVVPPPVNTSGHMMLPPPPTGHFSPPATAPPPPDCRLPTPLMVAGMQHQGQHHHPHPQHHERHHHQHHQQHHQDM